MEDVEMDDDLDADIEGDDMELPMDMGPDEEDALEEVFEIDENLLRSELKRLYRSGALDEAKELLKLKGIKKDMEHHFGGKGSGKSGVKGSYGGTGEGKSDVMGAFGGGKAGGIHLKSR